MAHGIRPIRRVVVGGIYGNGDSDENSSSIRRIVSIHKADDPKRLRLYPNVISLDVTYEVVDVRSGNGQKVGDTRRIPYRQFLQWAFVKI